MQNPQPPVISAEALSILPVLNSVQSDIDAWYQRSHGELLEVRERIHARLDALRRSVLGGRPPGSHPPQTPPHMQASSFQPSTPPQQAVGTDAMGRPRQLAASDLNTPPPGAKLTDFGSPPAGTETMTVDRLLARMYPQTLQSNLGGPAAGSTMTSGSARPTGGANSPPINFDSLVEQLAGREDSGTPNGRSPVMHDTLANPYSLPSPQTGGAPHSHYVSSAASQHHAAGSVPSGSVSVVPLEAMLQLDGQRKTRSARVSAYDSGRSVVAFEGNPQDDDLVPTLPTVPAAWHVLVEFKRRRVLQYDAEAYFHPGSHVVVVGDRGEDVGLVIYAWCEQTGQPVKGMCLIGASLSRSIGLGNGRVVRTATRSEVTQLLGIQAELEKRAVDVCQQRVLEYGVPMVIVDAEYQFDKKKLTFFFESQQRLDFRELVRDLFKTFRARIWMEGVANDGNKGGIVGSTA